MRILGIDSCGKTASVAVYDGKIAGEIYIDTEQTHSITLLPSVQWLLSGLGLKLSDMDYVASTIGPGSFTGVRIGMAAVKGMAAGAGIKCIGVSSLYAAAFAARDCDGFVCAVMDARCAQVYNANFMVNNGEIKRVCEDRALAISELMDEVKAIAKQILEETLDEGVTEWNQLKANVKDGLSKYLYQKTKRKPMILPVIMNV